MILTIKDFKFEAAVPGLFPALGSVSPNNQVVQAKVNSFIEKYEPLFLYLFFDGNRERVSELENYHNLPTEEQTNEQNNRLLAALKEPLSYYVAFYYFRNCVTTNTPIGGVVMQGENGTRVSTCTLNVQLWNQMCLMNRQIYAEILEKSYPNTEIFKTVNDMNL